MPLQSDKSALRGLSGSLAAGLCLLGIHLLARIIASPGPDEARLVLLRLWGSLTLTAIAWYGRFVLLPKARWPGFWWTFWPSLSLLLVRLRPLWDPIRAIAAFRAVAVLGLYFSLAELVAAVIRRSFHIGLDTARERQAALSEVRCSAGGGCFLTALAVALSLFLLSLDYIFDYLWYSFFSAIVVFAAFLSPLAVLGARLRQAVQPYLLRAADWEDEALTTAEDPERSLLFSRGSMVRRALRRTSRLDLAWWEWLYPIASSLVLLLAAMLR